MRTARFLKLFVTDAPDAPEGEGDMRFDIQDAVSDALVQTVGFAIAFAAAKRWLLADPIRPWPQLVLTMAVTVAVLVPMIVAFRWIRWIARNRTGVRP